MNVVVTGASGHVGTCLVHKLLEVGHQVRVVNFEPAPHLDTLDIEEVTGDVRDIHSLRTAFVNQDVLLHLAAFISVDDRDSALLKAVNTDGVRNAAQAALDCGIQRMVHVSSVEVYKMWRLGRPLREDDARADESDSAYARSKAAGEVALQEIVAQGLNATMLNPMGIIGPYDYAPSLAGRLLMQMYQGKVPLVPNGGFSWVDVRDVADMIIAAITKGGVGENYLLSSEYLTMMEIAQVCNEIGGKRSGYASMPMSLLHLGVPFAQFFNRFNNTRLSFTHHSLRTVNSQLTVDTSKAQRELDFQPRPVRETVHDTIAWFQKYNYLT
ncbi:MAG: NAD-dependent epimerase/dehydratase family protein [Chloroflexota bacterium]